MNVGYICYWGVNDVLTISSVIPSLEQLNNSEKITSIHLYTFERDAAKITLSYKLPSKVKLFQIQEQSKFGIISKIQSFKNVIKTLKSNHKISIYDFLIGRSVFGGIPCYYLNKSYKVSFVVESFEPHVDYMEDTGVWKVNSIKSRVLRYYHEQIVKNSRYLYTVSQNYKELLINKGINSNKIGVLPCVVDIDKFKRDETDGKIIRSQLNIDSDTVVGIYVGKFGGLYYDDLAFKIFKQTLSQFEKSHLILLSNQEKSEIEILASNNGLDINDFTVKCVINSEVPQYLSASDFAFATIRQFNSSQYSSAIKIGEYWANGLPIIISKGVGDDSKIVEYGKTGIVIDCENQEWKSIDFQKLLSIKSELIVNQAVKHRGWKQLENSYSKIISLFS